MTETSGNNTTMRKYEDTSRNHRRCCAAREKPQARLLRG